MVTIAACPVKSTDDYIIMRQEDKAKVRNVKVSCQDSMYKVMKTSVCGDCMNQVTDTVCIRYWCQ